MHTMLRIAYLGFSQFEKSRMSYLPLLENRKKMKLKKFTGFTAFSLLYMHTMLRVAYLGFSQFEKSRMGYLPLLENRKKNEIN